MLDCMKIMLSFTKRICFLKIMLECLQIMLSFTKRIFFKKKHACFLIKIMLEVRAPHHATFIKIAGFHQNHASV
jgi:hypothetical protein